MRESDGVDRILESLSQINVALEGIRVSLEGVIENACDHEQRLRDIERWKYGLSPVLTCVAFVVGAAFNAVLARFS